MELRRVLFRSFLQAWVPSNDTLDGRVIALRPPWDQPLKRKLSNFGKERNRPRSQPSANFASCRHLPEVSEEAEAGDVGHGMDSADLLHDLGGNPVQGRHRLDRGR